MNHERKSRLPEPTRHVGAFFHTVVGGLAVAAVLAVLHHVHIIWTR